MTSPRAGSHDTAIALTWGSGALTRPELDDAANEFARELKNRGVRRLATLMDNGAAWVVADRAATMADIVHVPLPLFFTPEQIQHAMSSAGVDAVLLPAALAGRWTDGSRSEALVAGVPLVLVALAVTTRPALPPATAKITFTSGTTGAPKGVCLTRSALEGVATSLVTAMQPLQIRRHLCVLPFAVLLENIAGLLAPLAAGATCIVLPLAELGVRGSSQFDAEQFHRAVSLHRPDSIILVPQMLRAWVGYLQQSGHRAPDTLRLVAVGGAAVGATLLKAAAAVGIPAFEGYGLSEAGSVQTLNLPDAARPGSAGKALPHARVRVSPAGEIEVAGCLMAGYLGDTPSANEWWPTGDKGSIDPDGFVHVEGRLKHVIITSFGRNVSPEWVETCLRNTPGIGEAIVFGEGQATLSAVIWPLTRDESLDSLNRSVEAANAQLPDYARVRTWVRATAAFNATDGMTTPNGKPRRRAIFDRHAADLSAAASNEQLNGATQ
ncbi:AMP-dependent synthetase/ligase [soil metagenome]